MGNNRVFEMNKTCSFFSTGTNGIITGDEKANICGLSTDRFILKTKANIDKSINKTVVAAFRDKKEVMVPLAGEITKKNKQNDYYIYECSFKGYSQPANRYIKKYLIAKKRKGKKPNGRLEN